ncbi:MULTISPECIES: septum formation initiator family protein [Aeromicrobium]|uniref:FtsB family cell division protein n=1 Tax=Aeromicrobium TaxID=2040 RepID=UPI0009E6ECBA|nr:MULTISPECIES: septum formation initiator family protein [Aeromicrobium]MBD8607982.1 septum formation initiator family protein [Aeromicrobium sp. CFBP 8757]MCL8250971.1 septum formation initiator family protein [Aeromicrobium fastidiosum]
MASRSPRGRGRPPARKPTATRGGRRTPRAAASATSRPGSTPAKPVTQGRIGSAPQLTTRAVVLLAVVLLLIASYTSTLHAWWQQRSDIQATKAEIATRQQAIVELEDQIDRWDDPAYVKQQAKERFGWVSPGEVGYRVIGSDGKVQGADVPTLDAPPARTDPDWYDKLWGSVKEAGKEPSATPTTDPEPDKVLKDQ